MCVSIAPARFTGTILLATDFHRDGKTWHSLWYQNQYENLDDGPNGMIVPIPADEDEPVGRDNFINTEGASTLLMDLKRALTPASRGLLSFGPTRGGGGSIDVFDVGESTLVLTKGAALDDVRAALETVREDRRPPFNEEVFGAYQSLYGNVPIVIRCFNGSGHAEPFAVEYVPEDESRLWMPGLDAHNGRAPKLGAQVDIDHYLIWGLGTLETNGQSVSHVRDRLPERLKQYVPQRLAARRLTGSAVNGDWSIDKWSFLAQGWDTPISRSAPTSIAA